MPPKTKFKRVTLLLNGSGHLFRSFLTALKPLRSRYSPYLGRAVIVLLFGMGMFGLGCKECTTEKTDSQASTVTAPVTDPPQSLRRAPAGKGQEVYAEYDSQNLPLMQEKARPSRPALRELQNTYLASIEDNMIDGDGEPVPEVILECLCEEMIPKVIQEPGPAKEDLVFIRARPQPINFHDIRRAIDYPYEARDAQIEGQVMVRVAVSNRGNYQTHTIVEASHPLLSQAVEAQLAKLQFTPAIQGGKPIPFWVNIPFNFTLLE